MVSSDLLVRLWDRTTVFAGKAFIASIFLLAGASVLMYATVHHTAQPQFCNSCHIMEPYYQSWVNSAHRDVPCIDCHYEPGAIETVEGKFKALSQLAKYVTRTQGTKPWAEVSDQSCMRSGCHSVRMLEGPVSFGRISFDHRQHLLESRRGRRLRCVSCHSQIVQGQHVAVTSSVCVTCHFMPARDGSVPARTSDCLTCHGPPTEAVMVAGRSFDHHDYVERGVDCRECHNPVIEGDGTVRKERCHSCHAEIGHIERIGETEFMHEKHVTEHKVECFECHDEIRHGLLPLQAPAATRKEGCGVCHQSSHDAARMLYAGTGAVGVEDQPSRMYQTRVVCEACHTGRSGHKLTAGLAPHAGILADVAAHGAPGNGAHASQVAAAGNVDCIHCHGVQYDGMSSQWQAAVNEQLDRLRPLLAELKQEMPADGDHPAWKPFTEAETNLSLVALDGSRGVHNVSYALATLRASAERIDLTRGALGLTSAIPAVADLPVRSKEGCTDCHAGAGRPESVWDGERAFPHQRHLHAGLECSTCHSTSEHGRPSFPREQCANCHHEEREDRDVSDCASCHTFQSQLLRGKVAAFDERAGPMSGMECIDCHGEPPTIVRPQPSMCTICHQSGYDQTQLDWQAKIAGLIARTEQALADAPNRNVETQAIERARKALEAIQRDGSRGVHNFDLAESLLEQALELVGPPQR